MNMITIPSHIYSTSIIVFFLLLSILILILIVTITRYIHRHRRFPLKSPENFLSLPQFTTKYERHGTIKGSLTWPESHSIHHEDHSSSFSLLPHCHCPSSSSSLTFAFKWEKDNQIFRIHLIQASNLFFQTFISDSYVRIELFTEKNSEQSLFFPSVRSHIVKMTSNPIYNEFFQFEQCPSSPSSFVVFTIITYDRFSRDQILGQVIYSIPFDDLNDQERTFISDITPRHEQFSKQELGQLLLSLSYQPSDEQLTLIVLKASNLPRTSPTRLISQFLLVLLRCHCSLSRLDPYFKIYMYYKNQRIMKKRSTIKRTSQSPVYNECFTFSLFEKNLDQIRFDVILFDYDHQLRHEPIGRFSIGSPDRHWMEICQGQKTKQIAQWYPLKAFHHRS